MAGRSFVKRMMDEACDLVCGLGWRDGKACDSAGVGDEHRDLLVLLFSC